MKIPYDIPLNNNKICVYLCVQRDVRILMMLSNTNITSIRTLRLLHDDMGCALSLELYRRDIVGANGGKRFCAISCMCVWWRMFVRCIVLAASYKYIRPYRKRWIKTTSDVYRFFIRLLLHIEIYCIIGSALHSILYTHYTQRLQWARTIYLCTYQYMQI